jgi:hypothetical protein
MPVAKQFIFDLDGSCGYNYRQDMLSFQKIDYPPWDMYFCHEYSYHFPLVDYLCKRFDLQPELDCVGLSPSSVSLFTFLLAIRFLLRHTLTHQ